MSTAAQQLRIAAAFAEARSLIDELGQDHPKAMMAMITAVNLADPAFMDAQLEELGMALPAPSHFTSEGEPLYSGDDIARSLGVPLDDFRDRVEDIVDAAEIAPAIPAHRVQ